MLKEISAQILSDIAAHNKYAKYLPEKLRRETWEETITRNKEMHLKKFPQLSAEIEEAYSLVYEKKILPSMRSIQFGGKPIEINPSRLYNCGFLPVDSIYAFSETMFLLLGGTGVGYSAQRHHIEQLPVIKKPLERKKRFLVSDSIEGWADAVKILFEAYYLGKSTPVFDYSDIRPKGARLITSGGKAPGAEPLKACIDIITDILESKKVGDQLTPLECHDIQCHIADAVLAGGIRRAALICLFSLDDDDILSCKSNFKINNWDYIYSEGPLNIVGEKVTGVKQIHVDQSGNSYYDIKVEVVEPGYGIKNKVLTWVPESDISQLENEGTLPWYHFQPQRGRSNNSISILRHRIKKAQFLKLWKRIKDSGAGEPGFYFTNDKEWGTNPCFTGDTLIATADGRMAIAIKELADSCNGEFNIPVYSARKLYTENKWTPEIQFAKAFKTGTKEVIRVVLSNGDSFECTENHLLATSSTEWVEAQYSLGINLESLTGNSLSVCGIFYEGKVEDVYDLTVLDNHNFYIVTDKNNVEGEAVLVHNCVEIALRPHQFCVAGDTKLITRNFGIRSIDKLVGVPVEIWNGEEWSLITPYQTGTEDRLHRVHFSDGSYLDATDNHKFLILSQTGKYEEYETLQLTELIKNYRLQLPLTNFCEDSGVQIDLDTAYRIGHSTFTRDITDAVSWNWSTTSALSFIAGWVDKQGSEATSGVSLFGGEDELRDAQLLLTKCGVYSIIDSQVNYLHIPDSSKIPCRLLKGGEYKVTEEEKYQYITSIETLEGLHSSYCLTEKKKNQCVFNNVLTKQCNLVEIDVSDVETQEDLNNRSKKAAFIATLQAAYTDFHYLRDIWKSNTEKDALIGVGQTGIASNSFENISLEEAANVVLEENERVSKILGINVAARTTTTKPSGCLDLNTRIRTSRGILSLEEIFSLNNIPFSTLGFIDPTEAIYVYDMNNEKKLITKLFNNGEVETLEIEFEDGNKVVCTSNHKFLTNDGWKSASDLSSTDDILSF